MALKGSGFKVYILEPETSTLSPEGTRSPRGMRRRTGDAPTSLGGRRGVGVGLLEGSWVAIRTLNPAP